MSDASIESRLADVVRADTRLLEIYGVLGPVVLVPLTSDWAADPSIPFASTFVETQSPLYAKALTQNHVGLRFGATSSCIHGCGFRMSELNAFLDRNESIRYTTAIKYGDTFFILLRINGHCPPSVDFGLGRWCGEGDLIPVLARGLADDEIYFPKFVPPLETRFEQLKWPGEVWRSFSEEKSQSVFKPRVKTDAQRLAEKREGEIMRSIYAALTRRRL